MTQADRWKPMEQRVGQAFIRPQPASQWQGTQLVSGRLCPACFPYLSPALPAGDPELLGPPEDPQRQADHGLPISPLHIMECQLIDAGCAAMRRGWKVPLRRAQIRHAIGRLCPGSVPLTQLPQAAVECGGSDSPPTPQTVSRAACGGLPSATWPSNPRLPDPSRVFAVVTGKHSE
ncbi:hypothetical protein KUCAC02_018900 [Chaenocephalus aceratus]|uniref:Uncharacterized protein n=1 Tax=Chaenocephalus aceratus TaxID=36190 RepID=A0ACB9WB95_CHAAC|nr:hypothetical protein KUCAC02_018900 [Chaenocephalus aceratus]